MSAEDDDPKVTMDDVMSQAGRRAPRRIVAELDVIRSDLDGLKAQLSDVTKDAPRARELAKDIAAIKVRLQAVQDGDPGQAAQDGQSDAGTGEPLRDLQRNRRLLAYIGAGVGVVWAAGCIIWAASRTTAVAREILASKSMLGPLTRGWAPEYGALEPFLLAAPIVTAVAGVWFGYQLVRFAERLLLPLDRLQDARILLGFRPPSLNAKVLEAQVRTVSELLDQVLTTATTVKSLTSGDELGEAPTPPSSTDPPRPAR